MFGPEHESIFADFADGGFGAVGSFGLGHSGMEAGSGRSINGIETETKLASSVCDIINQLDQTVMSPLMLKGNDT